MLSRSQTEASQMMTVTHQEVKPAEGQSPMHKRQCIGSFLHHWNSRPQEALTQLVEKEGTKMGLEETLWVFLESGWLHGVTPVTHIIALILDFTYWKDLPWYILVPHLLPSKLCPFLVWALTRSPNTSVILFLLFPIDMFPTCHAELLLLLPK